MKLLPRFATVCLFFLQGFCGMIAQESPWMILDGPYGGNAIAGLVSQSGTLFVKLDGGGPYRSTDNGLHWEPGYRFTRGSCLDSAGGLLIPVSRSTDDGETWGGEAWIYCAGGPNTTRYLSVHVTKAGTLLVGARIDWGYNGSIHRCNETGSWQEVNWSDGWGNRAIMGFDEMTDGTLFAIPDNANLRRSTNDGKTWQLVGGTEEELGIRRVLSLGTQDSSIIYAGVENGGLYKSTDKGAHWQALDTIIFGNLSVNAITVRRSDGVVWIGTNNGIFRSMDKGLSWISDSKGLVFGQVNCLFFDYGDETLYAGTNGGGIYKQSKGDSIWQQLVNGMRGLNLRNLLLDEANGTLYVQNYARQIYRTTDDGESWLVVTLGEFSTNYYSFGMCLGPREGLLYAGTASGLYRSTNGGLDWEFRSPGIFDFKLSSDADGWLYTSKGMWDIYPDSLLISTDEGLTWTSRSTEFLVAPLNDLVVDEETKAIYLGSRRSTDFGESWQEMANGIYVRGIDSKGILYSQGARSSDGGMTWTNLPAMPSPGSVRLELFRVDPHDNIYVAMSDNRLFYSSDHGDSWTRIFDMPQFSNLAIDSRGYLYATGGSIFRSRDRVLASNNDDNGDVPVEFRLEQNHPNPFNPVTEISFDIPVTSFVSLKIFNVLGEKVATLIDELKPPGRYTVTWDGSGHSSGTYFYKMVSGTFTRTRKLVLLR